MKREPAIHLAPLGDSDSYDANTGRFEAFDGIRSRRFIAYMIDVICIFFISILATIGAILLGIVTLGLLSPILALGLMLVPLAYHTLTIGSHWNATFGMRLMGLEVYLYSGEEPDYLIALAHSTLFYFTMALTSSLILLVSLFNPRGRLLHDYLTNSGVRRARS